MYIYTYIHLYTYTCTCTRLPITWRHPYANAHTHAHTHTHTHTHTYAHAHPHTHTHTQHPCAVRLALLKGEMHTVAELNDVHCPNMLVVTHGAPLSSVYEVWRALHLDFAELNVRERERERETKGVCVCWHIDILVYEVWRALPNLGWLRLLGSFKL